MSSRTREQGPVSENTKHSGDRTQKNRLKLSLEAASILASIPGERLNVLRRLSEQETITLSCRPSVPGQTTLQDMPLLQQQKHKHLDDIRQLPHWVWGSLHGREYVPDSIDLPGGETLSRKVPGPSKETVMFCQMGMQLNFLLRVCVCATGHSQKSPCQQQVTSESGHITGHTLRIRDWRLLIRRQDSCVTPPRPREPHRWGSGRIVETEGLEVCSGTQACPGPQNREGKKEKTQD